MVLQAISKELELRKNYLDGEKIETIYFGGGTPSILEESELKTLLNKVFELYEVTEKPEITLEANPDDLTVKKLRELKSIGVNRFSIGIQSFHQDDLEFLGRVHNHTEALNCIKKSQDLGFNNLNIDLIYGIPISNQEKWLENLEIFNTLEIPHLSAYALTIEPKTIYHVQMKKGKLPNVDDEMVREQFFTLLDFTQKNNIEQYEISNFCKEGFISKHNSNYWQYKKYLGVGPSAHSFNLKSRQWNVAINQTYADNLLERKKYFDIEDLTAVDQFNEYLMLGLRTKWGCDLEKLKAYKVEITDDFYHLIKKFKEQNLIFENENKLFLSAEGKILSDSIISELFVE
jgi:oxygen-independent coproporphyrinogen-3 oxidase